MAKPQTTGDAQPQASPTPQDASPTQIDVTYAFVWSEECASDNIRHEPGSQIRILNTKEPATGSGVQRCSASFTWREYEATYTCEFNPKNPTWPFDHFLVQKDSMVGGMEDLKSVDIGFITVVDDGGNDFLCVDFDFGSTETIERKGRVLGKRVLLNGQGSLELSKAERDRLSIDEKQWAASYEGSL